MLLGEFKIREDVEMYMGLHGYADFRGLIWRMGRIWRRFRKESMRDLRNRHVQLLNIAFLIVLAPERNCVVP